MVGVILISFNRIRYWGVAGDRWVGCNPGCCNLAGDCQDEAPRPPPVRLGWRTDCQPSSVHVERRALTIRRTRQQDHANRNHGSHTIAPQLTEFFTGIEQLIELWDGEAHIRVSKRRATTDAERRITPGKRRSALRFGLFICYFISDENA